MDTNIYNNRILQLRNSMKQAGIDAYVIPSSDYHQSEYVADYFKEGRFISGFTGSNSTLVITQEKALLWTDGRYFIQAEKELRGSIVELYKMFEEGYPTVEEYLSENLPKNSCIGFDGKIMGADFDGRIEKICNERKITIKYDANLLDSIWHDRPAFSLEPAFLLEESYTGDTISQKLEKIRNEMRKYGCSTHILCSLDDIAWTFQIRGKDIPSNPVVFAFAIMTLQETYLYIADEKLTVDMVEALNREGVAIKEYNAIYEDIENINGETILLDYNYVNYYIYKKVAAQNKIVNAMNPEKKYKAVKNEVEIKHTIDAHVKDGVAFTKFLYWLKNAIQNEKISEISAAERLEESRRKQQGFLELSFSTICAYKENAALMHYSATESTDKELKPEGLLLIDSGGQYMAGTTDITRTICLGPVSDKEKEHYTLVLKGMLRLSNAVFLHGCTGRNLDVLAREAIWRRNLDYKCGTGHGVGFLLNVHEGPNTFRWKSLKNGDDTILEEGMITTDEPGIYIEGEYGIRIENELLCKKGTHNEYGQFMHFETITFAPIDLEAVDYSLLTEEEKEWLVSYHRLVFEKIAPYLTEKEKEWLIKVTKI